MDRLSQMVGTQSTVLLSRINSSDDSSNIYNMFFSLFISSVLMTFVHTLSNQIYTPDIKYHITRFFENMNFFNREYQITMTSRRFYNKFGQDTNDITDEKLALLYVIHKNMDNYKDLFQLQQDYVKKVRYYDDESIIKKEFYSIDQTRTITIKKDGNKYINITSIDTTVNEDAEKKKDPKTVKTNDLIITSNISLSAIKAFITECVEEKKNDDNHNTDKYIYTYIGEDDESQLTYDEDLFVPYANFDYLVGNDVKKIEESFDFFESDAGKHWYKDRCLPYQMTHLYYGSPGTGKSIIASAVAKKYNLHIVKIKLSELKSNREFIKVFKNRKIGDKVVEYSDILYLFDEIDIELQKILDRMKNGKDESRVSTIKTAEEIDNKYPMVNKEINGTAVYNINSGPDINLSLGTILEEINGINQMYGRKIIMITNNIEVLREIHGGALVRPGRIDLTIELKKLLQKDCIKLLKNFYPNSNFKKDYINYFKDYQYTAAEISNMCKMNKNLDSLIKILNNTREETLI